MFEEEIHKKKKKNPNQKEAKCDRQTFLRHPTDFSAKQQQSSQHRQFLSRLENINLSVATRQTPETNGALGMLKVQQQIEHAVTTAAKIMFNCTCGSNCCQCRSSAMSGYIARVIFHQKRGCLHSEISGRYREIPPKAMS